MARPLQVKNTVLDLTLASDIEVNDDTEAYRSLYRAITAWSETYLIEEITFIQDVGNPLLFEWMAKRRNGRKLVSAFLFDSALDLDPDVTISLPLSWPLSVIVNGEMSRRRLLKIRADFGLTSFSVNFY